MSKSISPTFLLFLLIARSRNPLICDLVLSIILRIASRFPCGLALRELALLAMPSKKSSSLTEEKTEKTVEKAEKTTEKAEEKTEQTVEKEVEKSVEKTETVTEKVKTPEVTNPAPPAESKEKDNPVAAPPSGKGGGKK